MKYQIEIKVEGRAFITVEADSLQEAEEAADEGIWENKYPLINDDFEIVNHTIIAITEDKE